MEDRKLNSQESIELIARMLRNTQDNLQKNAGFFESGKAGFVCIR